MAALSLDFLDFLLYAPLANGTIGKELQTHAHGSRLAMRSCMASTRSLLETSVRPSASLATVEAGMVMSSSKSGMASLGAGT